MLLTVVSWRPKFSPQCRGCTIGVCMQAAYIAGASALLSCVSREGGITGYSCPCTQTTSTNWGDSCVQVKVGSIVEWSEQGPLRLEWMRS